MNSLTRVEMHNLMIDVAVREREFIQRRFVENKLSALHPQEDVDAILADFITLVSAHIGINFVITPKDFLPKHRDEGGPL